MSKKSVRDSVFGSVYNQNVFATQAAINNSIASSKDSLDYIQRLGLSCNLQIHTGCVNTICWNNTGEYLLSGSDDQCLAVTNPHTEKILLKFKTAHRANIFSARFMPQSNDHSFVSCSGDGIVLHTQLMSPTITRSTSDHHGESCLGVTTCMWSDKEAQLSLFNCHKSGTTYDVLTVPTEPRTFLSCGEDGTVRWFDLRQVSNCHKTCCKDNILVFSPSAVNAMDLTPISNNYLAVGSSDSIVRIYDRRYLSVIDFSDTTIPTKQRHTRPVKAYPMPASTNRQYRITCLKYSSDESELLVSYSSEYLYLFDLKQDGVNVQELCTRTGEDDGGQSSALPTLTPEQVTRRLRLRGDWSDTGPDARPENDSNSRVEIGQVRPQLQANLMSRMTEVISRLLNEPRTRMGITGQAQETSNENTDTRQNIEESAPTTSSAWRRAASRTLNLRRHDVQDVEMPIVSNSGNSGETQEDDEVGTTSTLNQELNDGEMEDKTKVFDYLRQKFVGHRNARTMIKEATFWGKNYVMSGSDCGHIFTWDKRTGKLVMLQQADHHVVNCLRPHPYLPYLASAGIDYDVKIWAPILSESGFDLEAAEKLMKRNAIMLEQTKDTITVPATFMIRMLACIHSLRNRERDSNTRNNNTTGNEGSENSNENSNT